MSETDNGYIEGQAEDRTEIVRTLEAITAKTMNMDDKESIAEEIATKAFKKRKQELLDELSSVCAELYKQVMAPCGDLLEKMHLLEKETPDDFSLFMKVRGGEYEDKRYGVGQGLWDVRTSTGYATGILPAGTIVPRNQPILTADKYKAVTEFEKVRDAIKKLEEEMYLFEKTTFQTIKPFRSPKALVKAWPEALRFLPKAYFRPHGSSLPSVNFQVINDALAKAA